MLVPIMLEGKGAVVHNDNESGALSRSVQIDISVALKRNADLVSYNGDALVAQSQVSRRGVRRLESFTRYQNYNCAGLCKDALL